METVLGREAQNKEEQQIYEWNKEEHDERGWKTSTAESFKGHHHPHPDKRQGRGHHGFEEYGVMSGELGNAPDTSHRHPIIEQAPRTMEADCRDDAIQIVFYGETNRTDKSVYTAVRGAAWPPEVGKCEFHDFLPLARSSLSFPPRRLIPLTVVTGMCTSSSNKPEVTVRNSSISARRSRV